MLFEIVNAKCSDRTETRIKKLESYMEDRKYNCRNVEKQFKKIKK